MYCRCHETAGSVGDSLQEPRQLASALPTEAQKKDFADSETKMLVSCAFIVIDPEKAMLTVFTMRRILQSTTAISLNFWHTTLVLNIMKHLMQGSMAIELVIQTSV